MKNYTLLLMVSGEVKDKIESLRQERLGTKLVDDLPPHFTIRGRFVLKDGILEEKLVDAVGQININMATISTEKIERIGNANVICLANNEVLDTHMRVLTQLEKITKSIRPEREKENFRAHVTLFRSEKPFMDFTLPPKINFGQLCLFEIDPSIEKKWVKRIFCRDLA